MASGTPERAVVVVSMAVALSLAAMVRRASALNIAAIAMGVAAWVWMLITTIAQGSA